MMADFGEYLHLLKKNSTFFLECEIVLKRLFTVDRVQMTSLIVQITSDPSE